jgi:hypothetical protein
VQSSTLVEDCDQSIATASFLCAHQELWTSMKAHLRDIRKGDTDCAVRYAKELAKDKDLLAPSLRLLSLLAHLALKRLVERLAPTSSMQSEAPSESQQREFSVIYEWAVFLQNVVEAERLIIERKFPAEQVLTPLFLGLGPTLGERLFFVSETVVG